MDTRVHLDARIVGLSLTPVALLTVIRRHFIPNNYLPVHAYLAAQMTRLCLLKRLYFRFLCLFRIDICSDKIGKGRIFNFFSVFPSYGFTLDTLTHIHCNRLVVNK